MKKSSTDQHISCDSKRRLFIDYVQNELGKSMEKRMMIVSNSFSYAFFGSIRKFSDQSLHLDDILILH